MYLINKKCEEQSCTAVWCNVFRVTGQLWRKNNRISDAFMRHQIKRVDLLDVWAMLKVQLLVDIVISPPISCSNYQLKGQHLIEHRGAFHILSLRNFCRTVKHLIMLSVFHRVKSHLSCLVSRMYHVWFNLISWLNPSIRNCSVIFS